MTSPSATTATTTGNRWPDRVRLLYAAFGLLLFGAGMATIEVGGLLIAVVAFAAWSFLFASETRAAAPTTPRGQLGPPRRRTLRGVAANAMAVDDAQWSAARMTQKRRSAH